MISFKKIIAALLASAIAAISFPAAVFAENDNSLDEQQIITVPEWKTSYSTSFTMKAGTNVIIPITLIEKESGVFSYAKVTMTTKSEELIIDKEPKRISYDENTGIYEIKFGITAPKTTVAGTYPLTISVDTYDIDRRQASSQTFEYSMKVTSELDPSGLTIVSCKQSKDVIKPGDAFNLVVTLKNTSGINIKDAELELTNMDQAKFVLDKGFTKQYVNIENGKTGTVTFSMIAQKGIQYTRETIGLNLNYSIDKDKPSLKRETSTSIIITCEPDAEKIAESFGAHDLTMTGYTVSSNEIKDGTKFALTVEIKNNSTNDMSSARVGVSADGTKFSVESGLGYSDFSIKAGETKKFTFNLIGCAGISSVRESIPVSLSFGTQNTSLNATVTCVPANDKANEGAGKYDLTMTSYSTDVSAVGENTMFTLNLTVKNNSSKKIENARISLQNLDGTKFAADSGLTYRDLNIDAGLSETLSFRLIGCAGIASIREVIPIEISYGAVSSTVYATVTCVPKKSDGTDEKGEKVFAPNIIIESYDFGGTNVTAGTTFPLSMVIKNSSSSAAIENLKVTVNGGASIKDGSRAFSPANSSNSFFFEKLGTKQTENIYIELLASSDAVPNSYPVEITFAYEYSVGKERYQAQPDTETITIPLRQEDRLTVNDPEVPSWAINVGEMVSVSTSAVNKGKSGVYNVTVTVEGDGFSAETPSYYIGNIGSGSEEYYDTKLTPFEEGELSGELVFTYEDANGEEKEIRKPFTFSAMSFSYDGMDGGMMFEDGGMMPEEPEENQGLPIWAWFAIGGGALVVVIVAIIIIVKAVKKKKAAELEADDEDL